MHSMLPRSCDCEKRKLEINLDKFKSNCKGFSPISSGKLALMEIMGLTNWCG